MENNDSLLKVNGHLPWDETSDAELLRMVDEEGLDWPECGLRLNRTSDGCYHRYKRIVRNRGLEDNSPRVGMPPWTAAEEDLIRHGKIRLRLTFKRIHERLLPGRSVLAIKARWLLMNTSLPEHEQKREDAAERRNKVKLKVPSSLLRANQEHVEALEQFYKRRAEQQSAAA